MSILNDMVAVNTGELSVRSRSAASMSTRACTASDWKNFGKFFLALSIISACGGVLFAFCLGENGGSVGNIGAVASLVFSAFSLAMTVVSDLVRSRDALLHDIPFP